MNKRIQIKPLDTLTDSEMSRLEAELKTIGGFDFTSVIKYTEPVKVEPRPEIKKTK